MKTKLLLILALFGFAAAGCNKPPSEAETKLALAREILKNGLESPRMAEVDAVRLEHALSKDLSAEQQKDERIKAIIAHLIATEWSHQQVMEAALAEVLTLEELKALKAFAETPMGRAIRAKENAPPIHYTEEERKAMEAWQATSAFRSIEEKSSLMNEKQRAISQQILEAMKAKLREQIKDLK